MLMIDVLKKIVMKIELERQNETQKNYDKPDELPNLTKPANLEKFEYLLFNVC